MQGCLPIVAHVPPSLQSRPNPRGSSTSRASRSTSQTPWSSSAVLESARDSGSCSRRPRTRSAGCGAGRWRRPTVLAAARRSFGRTTVRNPRHRHNRDGLWGTDRAIRPQHHEHAELVGPPRAPAPGASWRFSDEGAPPERPSRPGRARAGPERVVCGRGRNPTLSPPGVAVFGFRSPGPSGPAPATGPAGRSTGRASRA